MKETSQKFEEFYQTTSVSVSESKIPINSTLTNQVVTPNDVNGNYFGEQMVKSVLFCDAIEQAIERFQPERHSQVVFVEISLHPLLSHNISEIIQNSKQSANVVWTLKKELDDDFCIKKTVAELFSHFVIPD